jgi:hypothetical protein
MGSFNASLLAALLSAGVSPERAREVVEQFDRAIDERFGLHAQVLATKRDLAELEVRLTERIGETNRRLAEIDGAWRLGVSQLEGALAGRIVQVEGSLAGRIAQVEGALASRIAQVEGALAARIAETRADLVKWMLAALTAQTALIVGALKVL